MITVPERYGRETDRQTDRQLTVAWPRSVQSRGKNS